MSEFFGRFHPVLVHLPIGILLTAVLFYVLSLREKYNVLRQAATIALFLGMLSAIASCISGYLLSTVDDYDRQLVNTHMWMGIGVAATALVSWYLFYKKRNAGKWLLSLMTLLLFVTGHSGGSLTHGSDYLTKAFSTKAATAVRKPIPNVQEAAVYADVVQPLLESKCYSCHNANKQKGKLRLDKPELLMKGGEDGAVLLPGKADESEMIKRVRLPRQHEDHMPPKEKPQLTEKDISLLHWWINAGAPFDKKVKELAQPEKIKPLLVSLQKAEATEKENFLLPEKPVEKAAEPAVKTLKERGAVVLPVASNSHYLMVNFVTVPDLKDADIKLLLPLKKQLVWLKLGNQPVTDAALADIAQCGALVRLHLERTAITDKGLQLLHTLTNLRYLNLVGTKVTSKGLMALQTLRQLQTVYLYQTNIHGNEYKSLVTAFPKTKFDTGGYSVPVLPGDTTVYTKREIKNE